MAKVQSSSEQSEQKLENQSVENFQTQKIDNSQIVAKMNEVQETLDALYKAHNKTVNPLQAQMLRLREQLEANNAYNDSLEAGN
ncbi:MAG: hypothetical protein OXC46_08540 [Thaumarchaeota archaeon]|nr:hypothetical protein [Nitrososphaerota archaeon]